MLRWFLISILMVSAGPVLGITADQARRETEQAKVAVDNADRLVNSAGAAVSRVEKELDLMQRHRNELPRLQDQANRSAAAHRESLAATTAALPLAKKALDEAKQSLAPRQEAIREASVRLEEANKVVGQTRQRMMQSFIANDPGAQAAAARVAIALGKFDALAAAVLEKLAASAAYQEAVKAAEAKQGAVEDLRRNSAEPQKLAEASTDWMRAKGEIDALKTRAIDGDPAAAEARKELQSATVDLQTLKNAFDRGLASQPEYAAAVEGVKVQTKSVETARADLRTAQNAATASEARVREITFAEGNARKALAAADQDVARLNRDTINADADVRNCDQRLKQAKTDLQRVQQDRAKALQLLKQKQEQEDRVRRGGK